MDNAEWHDQDYLRLKWHVVCRGLATPGLIDVLALHERKIAHRLDSVC